METRKIGHIEHYSTITYHFLQEHGKQEQEKIKKYTYKHEYQASR